MIKFAGAMLVLIAGTLIGYVQAARFASRPKQIRQMIHALQRLETEIGYGQTPLPEALVRLSGAMPAPLGGLFAEAAERLRAPGGKMVSQIWEEVWMNGWNRTDMKASEREAILRLGSTLGSSERADQLKHVRLAMHQLQAEEAAARDEQMRFEKMCRSLGALGAALVVIVLL
jgi:stage III sporulation protein AB